MYGKKIEGVSQSLKENLINALISHLESPASMASIDPNEKIKISKEKERNFQQKAQVLLKKGHHNAAKDMLS